MTPEPNANEPTLSRVAWEGRYIKTIVDGRWEYVSRTNCREAVGIVPVTDAKELVLIAQYHPPIAGHAIQLPAGLVGDTQATRDEEVRTAAQRELLEETGYSAASLTRLYRGVTSPGLTDEVVTFFLATGLTKEHAGGGDESENIVVHLAPLSGIHEWLNQRQRQGCAIDLKIYAGLHFVDQPPV